MATLHKLIDIPATKYYFETFVVGAHHSVPHLLKDLLHRKSEIDLALNSNEHSTFVKDELLALQKLVDSKIEEVGYEHLNDIELAEPVYWINKLGKQCAIEISTYGRIRPETMELLVCLDDESFTAALAKAGGLSRIIDSKGSNALARTPVPENLPVLS